MAVRGVDPRDIEWEEDKPVYRVYFWSRPHAESVDRRRMSHASKEFRVTAADHVGEVLDWARSTSQGDRIFAVYVEHRQNDKLGLICLMGTDPNAAGSSDAPG